jgi:hypothetical protein
MGMDEVENGAVVYDRMRVSLLRIFVILINYNPPFRIRFVKLASRWAYTWEPIISIKTTRSSVKSSIWYVPLVSEHTG